MPFSIKLTRTVHVEHYKETNETPGGEEVRLRTEINTSNGTISHSQIRPLKNGGREISKVTSDWVAKNAHNLKQVDPLS